MENFIFCAVYFLTETLVLWGKEKYLSSLYEKLKNKVKCQFALI